MLQVYLGSLHETPVAVKILMRLEGTEGGQGGHQASSGQQPWGQQGDPQAHQQQDQQDHHQQQQELVTLSSPELAGLYKEAELMAAMRHPNVVTLMGVCAYPPALVTEYCSRGSLTDVLHGGARDAARARHLTWARRLHMVSAGGWGCFGAGPLHGVAGLCCLCVPACLPARVLSPADRTLPAAPSHCLPCFCFPCCRRWMPPRACWRSTPTAQPSSTVT